MLTIAKISDAQREKREEDARRLREIADRVEIGEISEFVIVANDRDEGSFMGVGSFDDRWRLLGAIEYAKHTVHEN
jgi:hypothetical protein